MGRNNGLCNAGRVCPEETGSVGAPRKVPQRAPPTCKDRQCRGCRFKTKKRESIITTGSPGGAGTFPVSTVGTQ